MIEKAFDVSHELRRLIAVGGITEDALRAITGIQPEALSAFLDEGQQGELAVGLSALPQALSAHESMRVSVLAAQLTEGMAVGDDERIVAILESLTVECRLTVQNIAQLTGLDVDDLQNTLNDPRSVRLEKKYEIAIRGSYLIGALSRARG